MSETERRHRYAYNRVLIEAQRILSSQFDDAVVFLSGAQIEMLRNVSQYLNRLTTYVAEYNPGYYLVPTSADFDSILEIVADMEETLMGNKNTIWGYNDTYAVLAQHPATPPGITTLYGGVVPEGECRKVQGATVSSVSATCTEIRLIAYAGGLHLVMDHQMNPADGLYYPFQFDITLKEGDYLYIKFYGLEQDDLVSCSLWGYKMKVPA